MAKRTWFKNSRNSIALPITWGVIAICVTIVILVAWSVIFTRYYMMSRGVRLLTNVEVGYWVVLSVGYVCLIMIATILLLFLVSNVRQRLYMRQQTTFIDSVTHELKSPLASLQLCLETMEMRELSPEMQSKFVGMMRADVERLSKFIQHILDAGQLEHDNYNLTIEQSPISGFIERNIQQIRQRHRIDENAIIANIEVDPDREIVTDTIALDTVILNLLDNAIKYSPNKKDVTISIRDHKNGLQIEVKDKGMGLPKKQLKRIFRRFYRFKRDRQSTVRGTGLGLYVVASLIERLGGKITAESEGEQSGSTFTIVLPWSLEPDGMKETITRLPTPSADTKGKS